MRNQANDMILAPCAVPFVVTSSLILASPTYAYAFSLGDAVQDVTSSPLACFGIGCASGALMAGLVMGLLSRRNRMMFEEQIEDAYEASHRAEVAAKHAEQLLRESQRQLKQQETMLRAREATLQQHREAHVADVPAEIDKDSHHEEQESLDVTNRVERRDLATLLRDRLGTDAFELSEPVQGSHFKAASSKSETSSRPAHLRADLVPDLPQAPAGALAPDKPAVSDAPHEPESELKPVAPTAMDPAERAASIDARVPRFDQSLFPDLTREKTSEVDDFELAMRAMDETLSATMLAVGDDEGFLPPDDHPEFNDASSYVDYLVQDEIERNRAGSARRFSRSQLTVFEGTGDLSSTRKMSRYRARHLRVAAREA